MNLDHTKIKTLGELKSAGYTSRSIKDELRENLLDKISKGEQVFEGVWGYENSVIPELERVLDRFCAQALFPVIRQLVDPHLLKNI